MKKILKHFFVLFICTYIYSVDEELILSADHVIGLEDEFIRAIKAGIKYAKEERLVTFGIVPTSPETGYGYLNLSEKPEKNPVKLLNFCLLYTSDAADE